MQPLTRLLEAVHPGRAFVFVFVLAFAVRLFAFLNLVPAEYKVPHTRWEMEAVAVSLAQTGEFANPYALPTGPTAHLPPVAPFLLSLVYRLFGLTETAGYVSWLLRMATYSAMYAMIPWLAGAFGVGRPAGLLAGITGALVAEWPGHGEGLTGIVLGLLLFAFLRRWSGRRSSPSASFLLGLGWGAAFHLQPALLTVLLGCIGFELWWKRSRRAWLLSAVMVLGVAIACVPWGLRNYTTFDDVFFIRSNLGLELRMAHHEGAAAAMDVMDTRGEFRHPRTHEEEARKLRQLGEAEYMRQAGSEAMEWMRAHPTETGALTVQRVIHIWFGPLHRPSTALAITALSLLAFVGAWRTVPSLTIPQRAVVLIPLATYPLIYYLVAYMPRYRVPLNWILLMLAGSEVWRWIRRK